LAQLINLGSNLNDYLASLAKASLGAVPLVGSLLSEIVGIIIPNQRSDRVAKFSNVLNSKIIELNEDFIRSQLTNENCTGLIEEGFLQSVRAVTDERREYIARLITNSLSSTEIDYIESKYLLRILGEINDSEVILLKDYVKYPISESDRKFKQRHQNVLRPTRPTLASEQRDIDRMTIWKSYHNHLHRLELLIPIYQKDNKTGQPKYDQFTGVMEVQRYELTRLGRLLLRHLDLISETNRK
jgi:hypothetical protein